MTIKPTCIPSGSQTVGPYFRIGLGHLIGKAPIDEASASNVIEIRGQVLDRDGKPVTDAVLEFWSADSSGAYSGATAGPKQYPRGFQRVVTNLKGGFSLVTPKPGPIPLGDGRLQAPHILVLVFARGLLRHLITRVYFDGEPANNLDPVLHEIPSTRRGSLIARSETTNPAIFQWNIILRGQDETVFFAW